MYAVVKKPTPILSDGSGNITLGSLITVVIVLVFWVIKRSAAYIGVPPLWGGEISLVILCAVFLRWKTVASFLRNTVGLLVLSFVVLPIPFVLLGYMEWGLKAFEDYAVFYYAIFVFFGYAAISNEKTQDFFIRIIYFGIVLNSLHFILARIFPLQEIAPKINDVALLGHNDSCYIYYSFGLAYALIFGSHLKIHSRLILWASIIIPYLIHFERAPVLAFSAVVVILLFHRNVWYNGLDNRHLITIVAVLLLIAVLTTAVASYAPDLGLKEKFGMQKELVFSIFGWSAELKERDGTREHRLQMWDKVWQDTLQKNVLFGQGFGHELTDVEFRHPHNSFVTIFGRLGLLGLFISVGIYIVLPFAAFMRVGKVINKKRQKRLLLYCCFWPAFLSGALFSPTLESPYSALVCNFMFGVFLRNYEIVTHGVRRNL
jgi:O-antigen ligase